MKSSSDLYPVSLLRADTLGSLSEDVYLIKHNLDSDKSVEVAVTHVMHDTVKHTVKPRLGSVVLVHGSFSNSGFWLSGKGEGLARLLLEQGFDVWLFEHRGHGNSPRNNDYFNNTVERYVLHDLKAANEFVHEKSGSYPFWIGHSLGGVMIAGAVASGVLSEQNCRGQVLIGTQTIARPNYLWIPFMRSLLKLKVQRSGELIGRKIGIGPENEPAGVIKEFVNRFRLLGRWQFVSTKQQLLPAWRSEQQVPLLAVIGAADTTDKTSGCLKFAELYGGPKDILLLGKKQGFARNYGHVDMVVSKDAAKEVWPRIANWLQEHC